MDQKQKIAWVVEDDPVYRSFISSFLKINGYTVVTFKTGEACIARLAETPNVVILDYYLGEGLTGLDVLANIKAYDNAIPVIFLSSLRDVKIAVSVVKAGCTDFIEKDKKVLARLRKALHDVEPTRSLTMVSR